MFIHIIFKLNHYCSLQAILTGADTFMVTMSATFVNIFVDGG